MIEPELDFDPAEIEPSIDWRGIWLRKADGKIEKADAPARTSSMSWNSSRLVALNVMLEDMQRLPDGYYHLAMSSEYPYMALLTERFHNPGWISVEDQLPEPLGLPDRPHHPMPPEGGWVLGWDGMREKIVGYVYGRFVDTKGLPFQCTHWMPLPEPPKKPE